MKVPSIEDTAEWAALAALPVLMAVQPGLPSFVRGSAAAMTRQQVLETLANGFVSAIASDVRAEILGDALGIRIPVDVRLRRIEAGTQLVIGVFEQTPPAAGKRWDGIHRGKVQWYGVIAPELLTYEPPII